MNAMAAALLGFFCQELLRSRAALMSESAAAPALRSISHAHQPSGAVGVLLRSSGLSHSASLRAMTLPVTGL